MKPEVPTDSDHPAHANLYQTLTLLKIETLTGPAFFIIEGQALFDGQAAPDERYFYEEHTCPTNFIRIPAIFTPTDDDPHGVFQHVRSMWMTREYKESTSNRDELLREYFPETTLDAASPTEDTP